MPTARWRPSWASRWCWRSLVRGGEGWEGWGGLLGLCGESGLQTCCLFVAAGTRPHVMLSPATALMPSLPPTAPAPAGKVAGDGNITSLRDPWFELVNSAVDASLASGGPLRGALFWQVCAPAALCVHRQGNRPRRNAQRQPASAAGVCAPCGIPWSRLFPRLVGCFPPAALLLTTVGRRVRATWRQCRPLR